MTSRNHVVITGTGRAGTSFLVELLTHLGLDTGFDIDSVGNLKDKIGRAGLEHDIRNPNCPYIVKSPWFCDYAQPVIQQENIKLEHIFIPIRELSAAAESRRFVTQTGSTAGGLWHTNSTELGVQENILTMQIYKLMFAISDSQVPITLIRYPKLTKDSQYLHRKLKPILGDMDFTQFSRVFDKVVNPEFVHSFNENDI